MSITDRSMVAFCGPGLTEGEAIIELGLITAMRMMVPAKIEVRCWHLINMVFSHTPSHHLFSENTTHRSKNPGSTQVKWQ